MADYSLRVYLLDGIKNDTKIKIVFEEGVRKADGPSNEENFSRNLSGPLRRAI